MDEEQGEKPGEGTTAEQFRCDDCDQSFKTAQGLAGHRRLTHSTSTRSALDAREATLNERETAAKRRETQIAREAAVTRQREVEVANRQREIAETGPAALGLSQCPDCRAWFDTAGDCQAHARRVHPIEDAVASEVARSRQRVDDVWSEAIRKQERHPDETPNQIVLRFLLPTDQKILHALLARNATFRKGGG